MKVKDLAVIFKTSTSELLNLLSNVGVDIKLQEETMVEKDVEKKLAKRYNVSYPFTGTVKNKPVNRVVIPGKTQPKVAPTQEQKEHEPILKEISKNNQPTKKAVPSKEEKAPLPKQKVSLNETPKVKKEENKVNDTKKVTTKKEEEIKPVVIADVRPKKVILNKYDTEIIEPRVDEETLAKYDHYLEDDEYNIVRENRSKRRDNFGESQPDEKRRKKNIKNTNNKNTEKRRSNVPVKANQNEDHVLYYEKGMTVLEIAEAMNVPVTDLVKKLFMSIGVMAVASSVLERETVELIAIEYDYEIKNKQITDMVRFDEMEIEDDEKDLVSRPPIVTIMGHVDHGKTTLLDTIRSSHVVKGEAGGITQHIGAYQVEKDGKLITFIDTPGHAAFTEMRARGAQITDIVILVVAADDGVMPQTKEAIEHAQAAKVPIIVAVNKMDKPGASSDRIKQELTEYNLLAEEWGGDTIFVEISALTGKGVSDLLDMVVLVSDLHNYKANPNRLGSGTVIEAKLDKGRGPVATLLVQNGTIKVGDIIVVGNTYGKIRAMQDELGRNVQTAGPSKPVEITGIADVPFAGEKFMIFNDERKAREVAETRAHIRFNEEKGVGKGVSLKELFNEQKDDSIKELNLIVKCDVQGSIEAIRGLLTKIDIPGTRINLVASRVGGVTETDINLAIASNAIIIGFNIRPSAAIIDLAKEKGIEIRLYDIIYKLQEDIEKAVEGMLDPVFEEKAAGEAEVRETFKVSKIGTIAGCYVTDGVIPRGAGVRLIRDSIVIYTGRLSSLKRFKDDVKEVKAGYECGLTIENYNDIKVGDRIECFVMEEVER